MSFFSLTTILFSMFLTSKTLSSTIDTNELAHALIKVSNGEKISLSTLAHNSSDILNKLNINQMELTEWKNSSYLGNNYKLGYVFIYAKPNRLFNQKVQINKSIELKIVFEIKSTAAQQLKTLAQTKYSILLEMIQNAHEINSESISPYLIEKKNVKINLHLSEQNRNYQNKYLVLKIPFDPNFLKVDILKSFLSILLLNDSHNFERVLVK